MLATCRRDTVHFLDGDNFGRFAEHALQVGQRTIGGQQEKFSPFKFYELDPISRMKRERSPYL